MRLMTQSDRLQATQKFFGPKAAGWNERFPHDGPQFERAVRELALQKGAAVLDVGCGTGRSFAPLRAAVGAAGHIMGLDATPEMIFAARRAGLESRVTLLLADALRLPLPHASQDAIFGAGLLPHFEDPELGLNELARVTRPGGKLAVFHPIGRVTLAARHQHTPSEDDVLAPGRLLRLCQATGWRLVDVDDADDRYLALAMRQ